MLQRLVTEPWGNPLYVGTLVYFCIDGTFIFRESSHFLQLRAASKYKTITLESFVVHIFLS